MDDRMAQVFKKFLPKSAKRRLKLILKTFFESCLYLSKGKKKFKINSIHIVFVCQGNVCRSAFAEYYLRSIASNSAVLVQSCGLNVHHNGPSPDLAIEVGRAFGVDLKPHFSKSYTDCDLAKADLIIPMEYSQYLHLLALFPIYKEKILLLKSFAAWPHRLACNIYDPYGLGKGEFADCFSQIQAAIDRLPVISKNLNR